MDWWIWILLGLALLLAELITPGGFYLLFFGVGAVIVGMMVALGIGGPAWLQIISLALLSLLSLWLFREKLLAKTRRVVNDKVDTLIGEIAVVLDDLAVNGVGKAEMRGTSWNTRNIGDRPLRRGERCRVERVEGLTIFVRAESN